LTVLGAQRSKAPSFEARIHLFSPTTSPSLECHCRLGIGSLLRC
jgi:hypothetical protein